VAPVPLGKSRVSFEIAVFEEALKAGPLKLKVSTPIPLSVRIGASEIAILTQNLGTGLQGDALAGHCGGAL
jgi:hypothetical protein